MKWYKLVPKDQHRNNWILFRDVDDKPIHLRERYRRAACQSCGKLDEYAAVRSGIDDDVRIAATSDVVGTDDDFLCFSEKSRQILDGLGVQGLDFVPLSGQRYSIAIPRMFVEVDVHKSGMQFFRQCMSCGRFGETSGGPGLAALGVIDTPEAAMLRAHRPQPLYDVSLSLPDDPLHIFEPRVLSESSFGRRAALHVSDVVRKTFVETKVTGVTFFELG